VNEGPRVEALTRRLAECPPELLAEPRCEGRPEGIHVAAVVSDLLEELGAPAPLDDGAAARWERAGAKERNLLRLTLVACWLSHDPWLRDAGRFAPAVEAWLAGGLAPLATLVSAEQFVADPDRREELCRLLLAALGVPPAGETAVQAADRLTELGSVERARVIRDTRAQQERGRKLREAMEAERARQAAARYAPE
jgi:hypothetical protein